MSDPLREDTRALLTAGFRAGWAAAMLRLADQFDAVDPGAAERLRAWAQQPDEVQCVPAEPGPDGHLVPRRGSDA